MDAALAMRSQAQAMPAVEAVALLDPRPLHNDSDIAGVADKGSGLDLQRAALIETGEPLDRETILASGWALATTVLSDWDLNNTIKLDRYARGPACVYVGAVVIDRARSRRAWPGSALSWTPRALLQVPASWRRMCMCMCIYKCVSDAMQQRGSRNPGTSVNEHRPVVAHAMPITRACASAAPSSQVAAVLSGVLLSRVQSGVP